MKSKFCSVVLLAALTCVSSMSAGVAVPQSVPVFMGHGAPTNGENEVQTLTFDDNITGGSFRLKWGNAATGNIAWSSNSLTLATNVQSALRALTSIGVNGVEVSDEDAEIGGHGDFTVTFSGAKVAKLDVPQLVVIANSLIGTTHTLTVVTNVPGVTADGRNGRMGAVYVDCDSGNIWCNTGMPPAVNWLAPPQPFTDAVSQLTLVAPFVNDGEGAGTAIKFANGFMGSVAIVFSSSLPFAASGGDGSTLTVGISDAPSASAVKTFMLSHLGGVLNTTLSNLGAGCSVTNSTGGLTLTVNYPQLLPVTVDALSDNILVNVVSTGVH